MVRKWVYGLIAMGLLGACTDSASHENMPAGMGGLRGGHPGYGQARTH
ncbi:hypothetical protein [Kozakia baliensis]|nr:hypothetical protein [Kozakia baliensis]